VRPERATPIAGGLGGYDVEVEATGMLLATVSGNLLRIDPANGGTTTVASGFGFATGLFTDASGSIWVLDGGFPGVATVYRLDAIPEPGTALLAALGFGMLAASRRRGASR
jgi:sugar lactone lactonase YvrE